MTPVATMARLILCLDLLLLFTEGVRASSRISHPPHREAVTPGRKRERGGFGALETILNGREEDEEKNNNQFLIYYTINTIWCYNHLYIKNKRLSKNCKPLEF